MSKIRVLGGFCKNGHLLDEENAALHQGKYLICRQCRKDYSKEKWAKCKDNPEFQGKMQVCRDDWLARHPQYAKKHWLKRVYGMTLEQYEEIIASQNNKCPICDDEMTKPHVDHDHGCCPAQYKTCGNCVRGIICHNCNLMLGRLKDREDIFLKAAEYMRTYRTRREAEPTPAPSEQ